MKLCALLAEYLAPEAFEIEICHDGQSGLERAHSSEYSLLILDVMLPKIGGFEILRRLRARGASTPVLMLTARGDDVDRIVGLEMGADDYLPKPFNPRELVARIKAILRRASTPDVLNENRPRERLCAGDLELDISARAAWRGGETLDLTTAEFDLLAVLMREAGQVVAREKIAREVFDRKLLRMDRTIDMHVSNLRKKLGTLPGGIERIITVRGAGYLLALPSD